MAPFAGQLSDVNLGEVLRMLASTKQTGQLQLKSPSEGTGMLWLADGELQSAKVTDQDGMDAIFQLILWDDAKFEFIESDIEPDAEKELAEYDSTALIDGISQKIEELEALREAVPSLDTKLVYLGSESLGDVETTPSELAMLLQADGTRTVEEIAGKFDMNPLEAARVLAKFRIAGALELADSVVPGAKSTGSLRLPEEEDEDQPPVYWRGKRVN